jgi:hypothetical protein
LEFVPKFLLSFPVRHFQQTWFFRIFAFVLILKVSGGDWAVLQTIAWTRMTIENSQVTESITLAVAKAFDVSKPCTMCKAIQEGREAEQEQDVQQATFIPELFYQDEQPVFAPPQHFWISAKPISLFDLRAERPPSPPPRSLLS